VKLVKQSGRTMADLAMELGISAKSIWEWVWLSEESGDSTSEDEKIDLSFGWWRSTCEW
jgi:transposase-like protein